MTRLPIGLLVAIALGGLACDAPDSHRGGSAPNSGGVAFPWPPLDAFEPAVQEHLRETRSSLEEVWGRAKSSAATPIGEAGIVYHGYALRVAALRAYARAEELAPNELRWPYLRGHALVAGEDLALSIEAFRRALTLDPSFIPAWVALGEVLLDLDRKPEAKKAFQSALAQDADCAAAHGGLGRIALEEKEYAAAVQSLETALRLSPQASSFRYPLGLAYRGLGDPDRALLEMKQRGQLRAPPFDPHLTQVREVPVGWRVHLRRGTTFFTEKKFDEAVREFEQAYASAPEVATVRLNLGSALVRTGRGESSWEHFEAAARLDPGAALPWFNLGVLAGRRGEDTKAVQFYERATHADSGLVDADFNRANALRRLRRDPEAIEAYRRVIEKEPGRLEARLGEALALVRLGNRTEAITRLELAVSVDESHRGARNALARLLATSPDGNPVRAIELGNQLVEEESSLEHVETLAMAYASAQRFDVAIDLQEKALAAARSAGVERWVQTLETNLRGYREGKPAREPWAADSPVISPPPLRPSTSGSSRQRPRRSLRSARRRSALGHRSACHSLSPA